jgi:hypothetical protein
VNPTPEQINHALPHVRYEIEAFLLTPKYDRSDEALEESVCFRKMVHCRALYDFFSQSGDIRQYRNYEDNVVSEDFSFARKKELYGPDPRPHLDRFNKDLLHITYSRLERTADDKAWPTQRLFPPVSEAAREFIDHILTNTTLAIDDA